MLLLDIQKWKLYGNQALSFVMQLWKVCVELRLVEDTHHRWPGARQWRHIRIAFHSVTIPLTSSQITRSQVKETSAGVVLTTRQFIQNI